jgi:hypothetical protein
VAFTITEADKGGFCQLTVVGTVEYGSGGQALHPAVTTFIDNHPGALFLLDVTKLKGRPDVLQSVQAVESMPKDTFELMGKLAVLDDISNRTSAIISESMMVNRRLNVKFFFDKTMAVSWLLK